MKKYIFISLLSIWFFGFQNVQAETTEWDFDKAHSNFYFTVGHIFSKINGRFGEYSGTVKFDPDNLADSKFIFEVKVDSINTQIAKRDKHLLSADFFNESEYPLIRFESKSIADAGNNLYNVSGTFTIKGKEYDLVLPLKFAGIKDHPAIKNTKVAGFNGNITIDRLAYGVGTGKFYEYGVVDKDVDILVSLEVLSKS